MQSRKPLPLYLNFSWTFAGNAIYAACQWGMLVVLARLGNPEMVGQFTLGLAVTAPVILLGNLQLRNIQVTDTRQHYQFGDYLGLRLITSGTALLVIWIITAVANYPWQTSLVIALMGIARVFEALSDVIYGLIQQHEQMDRIAISLAIKGPLSLLFLGAGVYWSGSVAGGVIGLTIAWAIVLFSYDIYSGASILQHAASSSELSNSRSIASISSLMCPQWHFKKLRELVWLALPLGVVTMLFSLNTNIPRYLIEQQLGEHTLGIFAAIAYLPVAGSMVVNPLGQSASPKLAKYYAAGNRAAFRALLLKLVSIGAFLGILGLLVAFVGGQSILTLLYGSEYGQHADLLLWLMVAAAIGYAVAFLGYGMTAARYFRPQLPLYITVSLVLTLSCLYLLPTLALQGIAFALIFAAVIEAVISLGVIIYALQQPDRNLS